VLKVQFLLVIQLLICVYDITIKTTRMTENKCDGYNIIVIILGMAFFAVVIQLFFTNICNTTDQKDIENFGALQSLYSNDGIQDAYLTIENDPDDPANHDPYAYWRGVTWNLPTRNLNRIMFYPYLYEYYVDRYAKLYPYW
jgi:hypothetical protein